MDSLVPYSQCPVIVEELQYKEVEETCWEEFVASRGGSRAVVLLSPLISPPTTARRTRNTLMVPETRRTAELSSRVKETYAFVREC